MLLEHKVGLNDGEQPAEKNVSSEYNLEGFNHWEVNVESLTTASSFRLSSTGVVGCYLMLIHQRLLKWQSSMHVASQPGCRKVCNDRCARDESSKSLFSFGYVQIQVDGLPQRQGVQTQVERNIQSQCRRAYVSWVLGGAVETAKNLLACHSSIDCAPCA